MNTLPTFGMTSQPTVVPGTSQVVIPQITIPQTLQYPSVQQNQTVQLQGPQLNKVHGMDGAKQFITVANAMYALFDDDDDVFYVKVTDKNNYPVTLKRYRFVEEPEPVPQPEPKYVTVEEFNQFKEEMLNAKQSVQYRQNAANTNANANANNSGRQPANAGK